MIALSPASGWYHRLPAFMRWVAVRAPSGMCPWTWAISVALSRGAEMVVPTEEATVHLLAVEDEGLILWVAMAGELDGEPRAVHVARSAYGLADWMVRVLRGDLSLWMVQAPAPPPPRPDSVTLQVTDMWLADFRAGGAR